MRGQSCVREAMKKIKSLSAACALALGSSAHLASAHLTGDDSHDRVAPKYDFSVKPPMGIVLRNHDEARRVILLAAINSSQPLLAAAGTTTSAAGVPGERRGPGGPEGKKKGERK